MVELDVFVIEMTRKWGSGRLPMLVDPQLRERFHRQAELFGKAYVFGDPEAIKIQSIGLLKAWRAMDAAAEAAGIQPVASVDPELPNEQGLPPVNWETGDDVDELFPPAKSSAAPPAASCGRPTR